MNITLTQNMIYFTLIILVIGKTLKPLIKKNRKVKLPLILMAIGIALSVIVGKLNGGSEFGNMAIQGLISSIVAQFGFDKVKDLLTKGVDDV